MSSSHCVGHVSADEARDGVRTGLAPVASASVLNGFPPLRSPINGDLLGSAACASSIGKKVVKRTFSIIRDYFIEKKVYQSDNISVIIIIECYEQHNCLTSQCL